MKNDQNNFITGIHSIAHALANRQRGNKKLFCTNSGLQDLKKIWSVIQSSPLEDFAEKVVLSDKAFKDKISDWTKQFSLTRRPSGQAVLICDSLPQLNFGGFLNQWREDEKLKLIALDNITDTNNGAAIMRTAAFFGVHGVLISFKGNFGQSPSFFRIASGATEYIPIVQCSSLAKAIQTLRQKEVRCFGFTEHSNLSIDELEPSNDFRGELLLFGSEDRGLSHSVLHTLKDEEKVRLVNRGPIQSLNVSVASSLGMNKFF